MVTAENLIKFENDIGETFNQGLIKAPIHLYSGNEQQMIDIFESIDIKEDWVCCTWRNHYQGLLKGIPEDTLKEYILKGKSMVMTIPEYKFVCSSIVGGIPSIATGIALSIKLRNKSNKVWCWVGDMGAETGAFHEAYKYSLNHNLPITFIVEDNKKSVCTPTDLIWNRTHPYFLTEPYKGGIVRQPNLIYYQYTNTLYPHAGAGKRIQF